MADDARDGEQRDRGGARLGAGGGAGLAAAAIVSGAAGYVVLVLAARGLDAATNADFLAFWAVLFALFGVLGGVQIESLRAVAAASGDGPNGASPLGAPVVPVALALGAAAAAALGASSPLWGRGVLGGDWPQLAGAIAIGVVLFAGHVGIVGALGGVGEWRAYAVLIAGESVLRLVLAAGAFVAASTLVGFAWASALGAGAWLLLALVRPSVRAATGARGDVAAGALVRGTMHASAAAAANALLVVGYPVLVRITATDHEYAGAAPLLLALILTRAPLLLPLGAFQGAAIAHVVAHRERGVRALAPAFRIVAALTIVGCLAAAAAGPPVLRLVEPGYDVGALTFALLVACAGCIAVLTLTGAACIALGGHRAFSAGWIAATLVALAVLAAPIGLDERVLASLVAGPVVGVAIHALGLRARARVASRDGRCATSS